MPAERIHKIKEDEYLVLKLDQMYADAIYSLIMWLDGWREDRHDVPGFFELLMSYRSAKTEKKGKTTHEI